MKLKNTGEGEAGGDFKFSYTRPCPEGWADAVVMSATEEYSSSGNEMFVLAIGVEGPEGGARADTYVVNTPAAEFRMREMIEALFPDQLEAWDNKDDVEIKAKDMKGKRLRGFFYREEYEGKIYNKVKTIAPHADGPGDGGADEDDDSPGDWDNV